MPCGVRSATSEMPAGSVGQGLSEVYSEAILDHARNPRWAAPIDRPYSAGDAVNPFCGDEAHVRLASGGKSVDGLCMQTVGCSINRAAGSMIAETLCGIPLADAASLAADYRILLAGGELAPNRREALGQLVLMETVRRFPVRIKCAMLSLTAVEQALGSAR